MDIYIKKGPYTGPVKAVVLDWAGTAVDYGCLGPAAVFVDVFARFDVEVTFDEARRFMGLEKKTHVRSMCALPAVADRWRQVHGKPPMHTDVDRLYAATETMMVETIARHADPIPGLLKTAEALRRQGILIGSCTGYTAPMMDVLAPAAHEKGYAPDAVVCSSDVPAGRPYPWMCFLNAMQLGVYPMEAMVKIGDTISDIQEGLNAGMWTIGLTRSGNELGLSREASEALNPAALSVRLSAIGKRYQEAGAHYVAEGIWEVLPLIDDIQARLARGERP
ncbi:MAG: phosphonoacetaldehyde hydrolase [Pseudomonadota bacterium]